MSTDHRLNAKQASRAAARVDAQRSERRSSCRRSSPSASRCRARSRRSTSKAIRFRMFNVDRLLTRGGLPVPAGSAEVFANVRRELEAAGFHTRSHAAPTSATVARDHDRRALSATAGSRRAAHGSSRRTSAKRAASRTAQPQRSDDRLFMQFLAFGGCRDAARGRPASVGGVARRRRLRGLERSARHRRPGAVADDPGYFLDVVRPLLASGPFARARR